MLPWEQKTTPGQSVPVPEATVNTFLSCSGAHATPLPRASLSQTNTPSLAFVSLMTLLLKDKLKHLKKKKIPGTLWRMIQRETILINSALKGNYGKDGNQGWRQGNVYKTLPR